MIFAFSGFEKMRFSSSGSSVFGGIATGTPPSTSKVYVNNGSNENIGNPTWGGALVINEYSNTLNANMGIEFKTRADGNGSGWRLSSLANNPDFVFESRSSSATWTERMRIDASGNVGIGNSSPGGKLQITVPSTERLPVLGTAYGSFRLVGSTNAWGLYMGIKDDTGAGSLQVMRGDNTVAYDFFLQPVGGNTIIGYSSSQGAYKLQVNSQIFATSSSIATSDGRYKENVDTITSGLDIVDSLRPVSFTWKDHPVHNFVAGKTVGFIAQEVKESLSQYDWIDNIIKTNTSDAILDEEGNEVTPAEEFLGIAESNIIPLLVAAVKELKARLETLEAN
jgi:hypothetical protein